LRIAIAGKGGKSGKGAGPRKRGVRVGKESVGKMGLEDKSDEVWEVRGTMIGEGRALVESEEEGWEVVEGLEREGDFWTNGKIKIRCGKKGLEESGGKVWEDKTIVDTFDRKVVKKDKLEEEKVENEDMEIDEEEEGKEKRERGEEVKEGKRVGEKEVEVIDLSSGSEKENGVGLIEEWKEEKRVKEKRLKDERRKREVKGAVNRGKDRGMGREEVLEMKQNFGDYEEMVGDVKYVLRIDRSLTRCFVMDREIRKVVDLMVSGDSGRRMDVRMMQKGRMREEDRVEVRSEIVLEVGQKEKEELKIEKGTKDSRTYGEGLRGVGSGIAEGERSYGNDGKREDELGGKWNRKGKEEWKGG